MGEADQFASGLLEEAKRFLEKARGENGEPAYLHAALVLGVSSLEAQVNGVADDLLTRSGLDALEQSLLAEKEVRLEAGVFALTSQLKMYRLTDRIEFLFEKFRKGPAAHEQWWGPLRESLRHRNALSHPKTPVVLC